ncbi:MAG: GYD domain-containing protein [Rhodospirillales bacterium]|mgnify:CR=1 FL=1|nr:GYD domain-containing protein [Rhodospirillales bacterium]MDP6644480.1 GYD domain-containing protein [Rhodospirillales bacterium]MDP6840207.1 GYD domain-containing protein [Rhodospirillales bacterium]
MPLYLTETSFSEDSLRALTHRPSDRREEVSKVIIAYGGSLHDFYWVFGDSDAIFIFDAPDPTAAMSILLTLSSAGAVTSHRTTALLSNEEAMEAMSLAGSKDTGYRTPREEWQGWQDHGGEG